MAMVNSIKKNLDDLAGGLLLMMIFTITWVVIAEVNIAGRDHWTTGIMFAFIIGYFYIMYNKITKASKYESNEIIKDETEKKRNKRFYIILAIEGIAIFVIQTVLLNIHHQEIFFPLFALIVGLHFFPLGKLYDSWFYYFTGIWICIVAIIALIIALKTNELSYIPAAIVGIGCAVATSVNGLRIIRESRISLNK